MRRFISRSPLSAARFAAFALLAAIAAAACGGSDSGSGFDQGVNPSVDGGSSGGSSGVGFGDGGGVAVTSVTLEPQTAAIESVDGSHATQNFRAIGHFADGTTSPLDTGVSWSADTPQAGAVDASGVYTASGSIGGVVKVTAKYRGVTGDTKLTVKLHLHSNVPNVPANVQGSLATATDQDAKVAWAYPYDGTVWPRGLLAPTLMWNGGNAADLYYLHVKNATFELEDYFTATNAPASRAVLDAALWQRFTDSSAGATEVKVARWDGQKATVIASHGWTVAAASMRGTIYYWSNDLGRVLRIKPGASKPDDFANQAPLNDPAKYTQASCLMTCHTVSADGSTLVSGGGTFGGSYDLKAGKPMVSLGGTWGRQGQGGATITDSSVVKWSNAALSPTGKYIVTNAMAQALTLDNDVNMGQSTGKYLGLYTTADGKAVPNSGLDGVPLTQPAWSPDGSRIAFVAAGDPSTWGTVPGLPWATPPLADLQIMQFDETKSPMAWAPTTIVKGGTDANSRINWPSMSPDGGWVVYSRTPSANTGVGPSDLYVASASAGNQEVRLAKLDGDGYPFAAGDRDRHFNYEPSFAPMAAGGYFWVVFTSRRTYGNILTGPAQLTKDGTGKTTSLGTKQLWVAAIDQNPQPGKDPSYPAFHLGGQDEANLAMRGFWAREPCKGDGQGCGSGTECCGGYCASAGDDGGALVCKSQALGCSQDGDKCTTTNDCCGAASGVSCINHVCSESTVR